MGMYFLAPALPAFLFLLFLLFLPHGLYLPLRKVLLPMRNPISSAPPGFTLPVTVRIREPPHVSVDDFRCPAVRMEQSAWNDCKGFLVCVRIAFADQALFFYCFGGIPEPHPGAGLRCFDSRCFSSFVPLYRTSFWTYHHGFPWTLPSF